MKVPGLDGMKVPGFDGMNVGGGSTAQLLRVKL